jgi:hypothetical protein
MQKLADVWEQLAKRRFICTQAAFESQKVVGGVIYGYHAEDNPSALLGSSEGGHDFLLVEDRYILDVWAAAYYGYKPIFDLQTDQVEILMLYGPRDMWIRAVIKDADTDMFYRLEG